MTTEDYDKERPTAYRWDDRRTHAVFGYGEPTSPALTLCGKRALVITTGGQVDCLRCLEEQVCCTCDTPCCEADVGVGVITCGSQHCSVHGPQDERYITSLSTQEDCEGNQS